MHLVDSGWQMDQLTPRTAVPWARRCNNWSRIRSMAPSPQGRALGGAGSTRPAPAALSRIRQPDEPMAHIRQLYLSCIPAASVEEVLRRRGF